jgi:protein O-mannosyl-transferase
MPKVKQRAASQSSHRKKVQSPGNGKWTGDLRIFLLGSLGIAAAVIVVYSEAFRAGFIWDDDAMVTDNRLIRMPGGLWRFWFSTEPPDYFPLVSSLLWIQWRLWGMNATGYHIVQVMLHALNSILLWRTARRLDIPAAWWAGMIYAVHPVNVETVAWITETKNTVPVALCLGSLLMILRSESTQSLRLYWGAVGLFLLALLGKTSVVMLPVILLIITWWKHGSLSRKDIGKSIPFFAVALVMGLVTVWFQSNRAIMHTVIREDGFMSRLAVAGTAVWFYLFKAVLPIHLSFVYPRWIIDPRSPLAYIPVGLLAAAFCALYVCRRRFGRSPFAALAAYVVCLLPVLGFLNIYFMRYSFVADHWQYPAMTVFAAAAAGAVGYCVQRIGSGAAQPAVVVGSLLLLVFMFLSRQQAALYRSNETLFTDVLKRNPEAWIAHNNLGIILAQRGDLEAAMGHYEKALGLKPDLPDAYLNIGNIQVVRKEYTAAEASFKKSLQMQSNYRTHNALGEVYIATKRPEDAITQFQSALQKAPDYYLVHRNLGDAYLDLGKFDSAVSAYENAVRFRPADPENHNRLARAYLKAGREDEAVSQLGKMNQIFPQYAPAWKNLAALLSKRGDKSGAVEALRRAAALDPADQSIQAEIARLERTP